MKSADVLDVRGHQCPYPVIALGKHLAAQPQVRTVTVWASDPASRYDIPAWCQLTGHQLTQTQDHGDYFSFEISCKPNEPSDQTG